MVVSHQIFKFRFQIRDAYWVSRWDQYCLLYRNGFLDIDTTRFLWQKLPLQFDLHKINMYASLPRFVGICLPVSVLCNRNFPIIPEQTWIRNTFRIVWQHAKTDRIFALTLKRRYTFTFPARMIFKLGQIQGGHSRWNNLSIGKKGKKKIPITRYFSIKSISRLINSLR